MTKRSDSVATKAIELIRIRGTVRSSWLAEQFGLSQSTISGSLAYYVARGVLVTCKVLRGASPGTENEYRLSAAGPRTAIEQDVAASRGSGKTLVVPSGPVPRAAVNAPSRLALDAQEGRAAKPAEPPKAPEAPITFPAPTGDWGKVVATSLGPLPEDKQVTIQAQELHSMTAETAPARRPFRVAIANDGSMILWVRGLDQPVDIDQADTRELVEYLRKLGQIDRPLLELPDVHTPALPSVQAQ
jgi:hypothetical protein